MNQSIIKLNKAKFNISWSNRPEDKDKIIVDFNSIINHFQLSGKFQLLHWQAKPRGLRQWGLYDNQLDTYTSMKKIDLRGKKCCGLQMDEEKIIYPPSAVILIQNEIS